MIKCQLCRKNFKIITCSHLQKIHKITIGEYKNQFGQKSIGKYFNVATLPKNDLRFKKWRKSLEKRPLSWNIGYTKYTHPSLAKISATFKRKKIDNFARWREKAKKEGLILDEWPSFKKNGDLAELIGVILGDGYIGKFPRTEVLNIFSNSHNRGFIKRYANLIEKIFRKKPTQRKQKGVNCVRITIYQKNISKRFSIPAGARKHKNIKIPFWILKNGTYLKRYLRGLYEAEGSFCVHKPTSTYKLLFSNRNKSLLINVYKALKILGFHPHKSGHQIQISRKKEVYKAKDAINFRKY